MFDSKLKAKIDLLESEIFRLRTDLYRQSQRDLPDYLRDSIKKKLDARRVLANLPSDSYYTEASANNLIDKLVDSLLKK